MLILLKFAVYVTAGLLVIGADLKNIETDKEKRPVGKIGYELQLRACKTAHPSAITWYRDSIKIENSTQYRIKEDGNCSVLIITKLASEHFKIKRWWANSTDDSVEYLQIDELAEIERITTERNETLRNSVSRTEGDKLSLICLLKGVSNRTVHISWLYKSESSGTTFEPFDNGTTTTYIEKDTIKFEKLSKKNRGYYQCVCTEYGVDTSKTILVRVRDKYAALWPFLGIVIEVLVLIVIIFTCEKRQAKKKKTYDDDQAGQTDTLMKSESEKVNATESEMKKRSGRH